MSTKKRKKEMARKETTSSRHPSPNRIEYLESLNAVLRDMDSDEKIQMKQGRISNSGKHGSLERMRDSTR